MAARDELLGLRLSRGAIDRRIEQGFLHPLFRGVYAVGRPDVSDHGRWLAAVLACSPDSYLSHWHAAALWGLRRSPGRIVHVSVPVSRSGLAGIAIHRVHALHPADRAMRAGIPVTSPVRTVVDLAACASPRVLRGLVEEAVRLELLDRGDLAAALARHRGVEVDALLGDHGVAVELDGYGYHGSWSARRRDHDRAARLSAVGLELLRFDREQVNDDPDAADAATRAALSRAAARRPAAHQASSS